MIWINKTENTKCTVIVNSCDAYADLWSPFFKLFNYYWPNCPYSVLLNTESNNLGIKDQFLGDIQIENKNVKNISYGQRMRSCLKQINTPIVLLLLDDFFFRDFVDQNRISQLVSLILEHDEVYNFCLEKTHDPFDVDDKKFKGFLKRSKFGAYRYNLQAGLWKRDKLIDAWMDFESPWQWELFGNMRSWRTDGVYYVMSNDECELISYGKTNEIWGVFRGKWVVDDVQPLFEMHGIHIDYSLRGVCTSNDIEIIPQIVPASRDIIHSIGIGRYIDYNKWKFKKKIFGDMAQDTYMNYLNKRYYSKRRKVIIEGENK
jgi:hypothetical protein